MKRRSQSFSGKEGMPQPFSANGISVIIKNSFLCSMVSMNISACPIQTTCGLWITAAAPSLMKIRAKNPVNCSILYCRSSMAMKKSQRSLAWMTRPRLRHNTQSEQSTLSTATRTGLFFSTSLIPWRTYPLASRINSRERASRECTAM